MSVGFFFFFFFFWAFARHVGQTAHTCVFTNTLRRATRKLHPWLSLATLRLEQRQACFSEEDCKNVDTFLYPTLIKRPLWASVISLFEPYSMSRILGLTLPGSWDKCVSTANGSPPATDIYRRRRGRRLVKVAQTTMKTDLIITPYYQNPKASRRDRACVQTKTLYFCAVLNVCKDLRRSSACQRPVCT